MGDLFGGGGFFWGEGGIIFGGVGDDFLFFPYPIFFLHESFSYGLIRLPPEFQHPRQTPSGRKVRAWKKEEEERKKNNAKFSGHYIRPRTHNVRAQALRSHQCKVNQFPLDRSQKNTIGPKPTIIYFIFTNI